MTSPWPRSIAFLLIPVMTAACSQTLRHSKPDADYFYDAAQCNTQTAMTTRLKINLGGLGTRYGNVNVGGSAADIPLTLGTDQQNYRLCMEKQGWKVDPAKDPYLASIDTCRKSATTPTTSRMEETGDISISSGLDSSRFDECLRNKGVYGTVTILPIKPVPPE